VGKKLVRREGLTLTIAALLLAIGCQKSTSRAPRPSGEPAVRATVATIRTTVQPANKTYVHALMVANDLARSGDEVDQWRLFDLKKQQVTFIDDVAKTYRVASLAAVTKEHRDAYGKQPAPELPLATWTATGAKKTVNGFEATQAIVKLGGYQRELWIAEKTPLPAQLFALMRASEPAPSPVAGVANAIDEALLNVRGFPVADHAELPYDNKKLVVDHAVVKVEQKELPASWFAVPRGYRDISPLAPQGGERVPQAGEGSRLQR